MCTALPNTRAMLERNDCGTPLSMINFLHLFNLARAIARS